MTSGFKGELLFLCGIAFLHVHAINSFMLGCK
ncbi:hypothetical protein IOK_09174 [Yersinia enterocolitica subsp. palearctica PhRBD_Ye1]|nr:hypothetical protein IOK_09174 [Yersinia enterocolitica subsp. palearctica PhRBD_Ye1]